MTANVEKYIVDKDSFKRMQNVELTFDGMTYEQFYAWNTKCISELPNEEQMMLRTLCKRFQNGTMTQMTLEDCVIFNCDSFYFDTEKRLCIVTPR